MPVKYAVNINENHLIVQMLPIFPEFTLGKTVPLFSLLEGSQYPEDIIIDLKNKKMEYVSLLPPPPLKKED